MSKFDKYPELTPPRISRTALRHALELDFIQHPGRFCLRVVLRFVKGWALAQLFGWAAFGGLLLGALLLDPADFAVQVRTVSQVNYWAAQFRVEIGIFAWGYGVMFGAIFAVCCTLEDGMKQARRLAEQRGFIYGKY